MVNPPSEKLPDSEAVVRVFIEDTSRLDQGARRIAESSIRVDQLVSRIPVEITCREPAGSERFTVRVHVDLNGSGQVESGDLVSTAAHPAVDGDVQVPVKRVT